MAAINDFNDILLAMQQNPQLQEAMRDHVLGEEIRQLPAVVHRQGALLTQALERLDELVTTLRDVSEQIAGYAMVSSRVITATVERQDRIEADIAELKAAQARLEASVQEMRESQVRMETRQDRMENDIAELKTDMTEVKADVAELKTDMTEVKADVAELKTDMTEVKADVAELKTDMTEVKADVAELKTDMTEVKADVAELKTDMTEVKADVAELKTDMTEVKADVAELKTDMTEVKADVAELKTDMTEVKADVAELKTDMTEVKADVAELKTDMTEVKADVAELKTGQATTNRRLNHIEGQLGNLNGWRLESDVHKNITSIVHRYLTLDGTYVLKSGILPQTNELDNILRQARIAGHITREQVQEALDADIIVTAEDDDDRKYVIVAEVSRTLDNTDITRAAQRARIMGDATGYSHIAIAIAQTIALQQQELAASENVAIVQMPDPDTTPQRPNNPAIAE